MYCDSTEPKQAEAVCTIEDLDTLHTSVESTGCASRALLLLHQHHGGLEGPRDDASQVGVNVLLLRICGLPGSLCLLVLLVCSEAWEKLDKWLVLVWVVGVSPTECVLWETGDVANVMVL